MNHTINSVTRCLIVSLFVATSACSKDTPTAPTPPPVASCVTNNTAQLAFGNVSAARTYAVLFNGALVATLGPGQTTPSAPVAAGVQHTILFTYANTNNQLACNPLTPVLAQCQVQTYTCAF